MEIIKSFKVKYETAKAEAEKGLVYLARLETKRNNLAEGLPTLADEVAAGKAEAEVAMTRYIGDEIGETELAEARSKVAGLERKQREARGLIDALEVEILKAQSAVKEARDATQRAHSKLWDQVSRVETERARATGIATIKRAYIARRRSTMAGCCPSLPEFIGEVYEALSLSTNEEGSLFAELEVKFGVSRF